MSQDNLKEYGVKRKMCSSQETESQMKWHRKKTRKVPRRRSSSRGQVRDKTLLCFSLQLNTLINYAMGWKGEVVPMFPLFKGLGK